MVDKQAGWCFLWLPSFLADALPGATSHLLLGSRNTECLLTGRGRPQCTAVQSTAPGLVWPRGCQRSHLQLGELGRTRPQCS